MKKLGLLIALSVLLVACSNNKEGYELNSNLIDIGDLGEDFDLVRDLNTGCVYVYNYSNYEPAFTAYYGEDGKVVGCGEKNFDKDKYK